MESLGIQKPTEKQNRRKKKKEKKNQYPTRNISNMILLNLSCLRLPYTPFKNIYFSSSFLHPSFLFFLSILLPLLPLSPSPSPILGKTIQIREIRITSSILTLHILTGFLYSPEICVVAVGFFDAFELCE